MTIASFEGKRPRIGAGTYVHPSADVFGDVTLGAGTRLLSHVVITGKVVIGKNNVIHPGSVIGGDPQDLKYRGEDSQVEIGDGGLEGDGGAAPEGPETRQQHKAKDSDRRSHCGSVPYPRDRIANREFPP